MNSTYLQSVGCSCVSFIQPLHISKWCLATHKHKYCLFLILPPRGAYIMHPAACHGCTGAEGEPVQDLWTCSSSCLLALVPSSSPGHSSSSLIWPWWFHFHFQHGPREDYHIKIDNRVLLYLGCPTQMHLFPTLEDGDLLVTVMVYDQTEDLCIFLHCPVLLSLQCCGCNLGVIYGLSWMPAAVFDCLSITHYNNVENSDFFWECFLLHLAFPHSFSTTKRYF